MQRVPQEQFVHVTMTYINAALELLAPIMLENNDFSKFFEYFRTKADIGREKFFTILLLNFPISLTYSKFSKFPLVIVQYKY